MIIAFFLKTLCDISYYMCFAAIIGSAFGVHTTLLSYVLLLSLCAALSMALDSKKRSPFLRFIPIAFGAAGILLAGDLLTALVLLPPLLYTAYICWKRYFCPEYYHSVASFKALIAVLGIVVLFVAISGGSNALQAYSGPFIVMYVLGSVLLMRMLRHSERTMRQPAFILMNIASIAGVCLLSIFMSTSTGLKIMKAILLSAYKIIMLPVVYVLGPIIGAVCWVFVKLFSLIPAHTQRVQDGNAEDTIKKHLDERFKAQFPKETLYIILAVCLAALLIYIFKKLLDKNKHKEEGPDSHSYYEYVSPPKKQLSFSSFFPTTPTGQVRFYYRKLLLFFIKQDIPITKNMDTSEIEKHACRLKPEKKDFIKRMRLIYQPARYGKGVNKQAAAEAKNLYHEIKKASK